MTRPVLLLLLCVPAFAQNPAEDIIKLLRPSIPPPDGRMNATDRTWEEWVRRTGAQPPDFARMPSIPGLPDPLIIREGIDPVRVTTPALWDIQKGLLKASVEQWMFGKMPPAPDNLRATVTGTRREGGSTIRQVKLEFGPDHRATLRIELVIPDGPGPFPVFLTNHARNRPWIYTAVRRGYIACIYHATDPRYGNGDDSDAWIEVYPEYDFSVLARWAWAASRAVDYLVKQPEVDAKKIGLAGHSRNGKQALLAAAFDERIGAVIPSSGNSGEVDPWRYTTETFANESIELLAGAQAHWFHPRLRFFAGREEKLPVDQNSLLSLVAPRGLMLYSGYAEAAGNPVGFEQAYHSALTVYQFLKKPENIWLHLRNGEHDTTAGDVENFIDFFDAVFGRRAQAKIETWIHGYTFAEWQRLSGEKIDPMSYPVRGTGVNEPPAELRKHLQWALGEEPPGVPNPPLKTLPRPIDSAGGWLEGLFQRPAANLATRARIAKEGMGWAEIPFGDGLKADLFYPLDKPNGKWPLVIWLHGYSYQNGWSVSQPWTSTGTNFRLDQRPSFPELIKRGFAVLTFDQIGFGTRVLDARDFYKRYPKWSLMGKMVSDTRAAIDAVSALDLIDQSRISLLGFSLGAKVGLLTTALDARVTTLAAVAGYDPLRLDTAAKGVEGIRHFSHLHGLMPRLGFFVGNEARLPFDFEEALALVAPRRTLIVAPLQDHYARVEDVRTQIEPLQNRFSGALKLDTPSGFNAFAQPLQQRVFDWLAQPKY